MKKYIILALVALLAAVLFVACDNDVKVDNNTAYTEVLESEGAFVVNGKGYDTLQSAIQAAVDGKTSADHVVITMTRNITSRPVVIPAGADIRLYLGGHKLTFIDVETSAISVVSDDYDQTTFFLLTNGTVALLENSNDRNVIDVKAIGEEYSSAYVDLSGVTVNGNISVAGGAGGDAELWVDSKTEVNGKVKAEGETPLDSEYYPWLDANATLYVESDLNDVEMTNAYLDVKSSGHVVLTALDGGNYFVATSETSITNETDVAIVVYGGVCYIQRGEVFSYYGSLQAALNDLDADNLTIIFRDDYNKSELAVEAGAGRPVIIDLNGHNVTVASITADAALTIVNSNVPNMPAASATFKGNIIAAGSVKAFGCGLTGSVTADGDICMDSVSFIENSGNNIHAKKGGKISITNCTGTVGDIVATNVAGSEPGTITIDNRNGVLWTYNLKAADEAETKFGDIAISTNNVEFVKVIGSVTGAAVTAGSSANNSEEKGATFHRSIAATGLISISNSFVSPMDNLIISTSAEDEGGVPAISMTNVTLNWVNQNAEIYVKIEATAGGSISLYTCHGYASNVTSLKSVTISGNSELEVNRISTKDLTVSSTCLIADRVEANGVVKIDSGVYGSVEITGSGDSRISGGTFGYYDSLLYGNFTYKGTGTLTVTGGDFYGTTKFLSGSSIVLDDSGDDVYNLYFNDIDAVTDNVHIKSAVIDEDSLADVEKIVNRINQDSDSQQIININYKPYNSSTGKNIVNLTGVDNVFNMTSVNIRSANSACLDFTTVETDEYDTDDVVKSGLIVGSYDSTPASATFNYNNGSGKNQLVVTGRIGLLEGGNVIYSTQLNDSLVVYGCTYELVDDNTENDVYGYVIRDDVYGVASMAGYYEYRYNGN